MKKDMLLLFMLATSATAISQNVGIGTATPLEKLSVVSNTGYGISHESSSIKLSTYIDGSGGYFGTVTNHPFHLYTNNGAAQFTLLQDGNVGIGNINPQYKLDIIGRMRIRTGSVGNIFTSSGIWMDDYRDGSPRIFLGMQDSIRLGIWGEGTPGVGWGLNFNARNGNIGIGVSNPVNKLEVAGSILATGTFSSTGNITSNGYVKGNSFQYNSPKTCYLSIGPADFIPDEANSYTITSYSVYLGTVGSNLYAPVHLPHGAVVTEMKVLFFDYHDPRNLTVYLMKANDNVIGNVSFMAQITSSGFSSSSQTISDNSIVEPVIDNTANLYSILATTDPDIWPGFNIKLYRVQITYTISESD